MTGKRASWGEEEGTKPLFPQDIMESFPNVTVRMGYLLLLVVIFIKGKTWCYFIEGGGEGAKSVRRAKPKTVVLK